MPQGSSHAEAQQAAWEARQDKKRKRQEIAEGPRSADVQRQERLAEKQRANTELKLMRDKGRRDAAERKAKESMGEEFTATVRTINAYLAHPKLSAIIEPESLGKPPKNLEEARARLDQIRHRIRAHRGSAMVQKGATMIAYGMERCNPQSVTGLDLRGFGDAVAANEEQIELEVAEAECELGQYIQTPWYMSLGLKFAMMAKEYSDKMPERMRMMNAEV